MISSAHRASRRGRPRGEGFVLLEAVVALTILGTVVVAVLALIGTQVRSADRAVTLLAARSLAEERLTAIEILERDDLLALPDSLVTGRFDPPFEAYTWFATVQPVPDAHELYVVEVVVEADGVAFPLRTMLHRPAPLLTAEPER